MNKPVRFLGITPYLHYEAAGDMLDWLSRTFAFEERARYVDADGVVREAELALGDHQIWLCGHDIGALSERSADRDQLTLIWVDDVEAHHAHVVAAGVEAPSPEDKSYAVRMYSVKDPQGYEWAFVQALDQPYDPEAGGLEEIRT
jgi:uncharacterized glyoxalase superfamily protein PhnB